MAALRKSLLNGVTEEDVTKLGQELLKRAMSGDVAAAKVLLSYVVGKPTEVISPDRIELEAWKLIQSWPTIAEYIATLIVVPPETAAEGVKNVAPTSQDVLMQRIAIRAVLESARAHYPPA